MIIFLIGLLVFLLCLSAFLSASETSLFSLSQPTLKTYQQASDRRLIRIADLVKHPRDLLVTLLMLNVTANLLVQNTVSTLFDAIPSWAYRVGIPLVLTLVFGEVLPKSIALSKNISISYRVQPVISFISGILKPIRKPIIRLTSWISRALFFFLSEEKEISSDELKAVLKTSRETGILFPQECDLIGGILDLQHSSVKEHMRPRDEIHYYDIEKPLRELEKLLVDLEITRVPVCVGGLEKVLGIMTAGKYLVHQSQIRNGEDVQNFLKPVVYVPETTRAWTFLQALRQGHGSLALVVDEYGSISGLITQEDLIEGVVGEIRDRRDQGELYSKTGRDEILANGKLELSDFEEIFQVSLKKETQAVTLGGWLIEQMGEIPTAGTKYTTEQFLFYVVAADPNRIRQVYVRKIR